jgi:bifunctional DNA-binding transcriptional regulator/antitoxin component of YhaV-PrlF toxin-antitoxin module
MLLQEFHGNESEFLGQSEHYGLDFSITPGRQVNLREFTFLDWADLVKFTFKVSMVNQEFTFTTSLEVNSGTSQTFDTVCNLKFEVNDMTMVKSDKSQSEHSNRRELTALKPVRVNVLANGKLVLPVEVRRVLGLEVGDALSLSVGAEGVISLVSVRLQVLALRGKYRNTTISRSGSLQTQTTREPSGQDQSAVPSAQPVSSKSNSEGLS